MTTAKFGIKLNDDFKVYLEVSQPFNLTQAKKFNGMIQALINNFENQTQNLRLERIDGDTNRGRIAVVNKILNNKQKTDEFLNDYKYLSIREICSKYGIHKYDIYKWRDAILNYYKEQGIDVSEYEKMIIQNRERCKATILNKIKYTNLFDTKEKINEFLKDYELGLENKNNNRQKIKEKYGKSWEKIMKMRYTALMKQKEM